MSEITSLLGDNVYDGQFNKIDTKTKCAGKVVGLYFSAHWCGPCVNFTPKLAEFYKKHHDEKKFEIIFVSADSDEDSFKEYFATMPWLALSFDESEINEKLNAKFKVNGIPTLVLVDYDSGDLLVEDGVLYVTEDPEGTEFPWKETKIGKVELSDLTEEKIQDREGNKINLKEKCAGKILGLYFSGHWCGPCVNFTPKLAELYKKHHEAKNFEILFISSDRDENAFKDYYGTMPWLALVYAERKTKENLSRKYEVSGIPTLILLDFDTETILNNDAVEFVMDDAEAKGFPWKEIKLGLSDLTDETAIINGQGNKINLKEICSGKIVGVYFSAHWCGPCVEFTPKLAEFYKKHHDEKKFEIIFVSADSDEDSFKEYFATMPWLSLAFSEKLVKAALGKTYKVYGIPSLKLIDFDTGNVLNEDAVSSIRNDEDVNNFPWKKSD